MQPRRAELFFSRCSGEAANRPVKKASERGTEQSTPAGPALSYIPSTTCGYERATPRILLSGCSHRDQARSPISASSSHLLPPPAELIVLARCTDYGPSTCSTSAPRNNPGTPRLYCLKRPSHGVPAKDLFFLSLMLVQLVDIKLVIEGNFIKRDSRFPRTINVCNLCRF